MYRAAVILTLLLVPAVPAADRPVVVGCKNDVEGRVLAEMMAQLLEDRGIPVKRRFSLGGTLICFEALKNGEIDVYPEYSGTLAQAILKVDGGTPPAQLRDLARQRLRMELLGFFGFNNTYALTVRRQTAERDGLHTISDLARHPELRLGFSNEFMNRPDGWPGLARTYGLTAHPVGVEHKLAYEAMRHDQLDVTDAYSTDGEIKLFDLVVLEDDRHYFPSYLAAPLARADLDARAKGVLEELRGRLSETDMVALNGDLVQHKELAGIVATFLRAKGLLGRELPGRALPAASAPSPPPAHGIDWGYLLTLTGQHLELTFLSLLAGMVVALPLGVLIYRLRTVSRLALYAAGVLQTIPSIALLAFLIPLFGIGWRPAVVALFLYALLPILRNTVTALFSIDPVLRKVAVGMGLTPWQRLRYVELPLAAPTILAGVRTAAVITIGTATLAAFIGAGGLGEPIVTGLALNDTRLILEGAVPAALLAVVTERAFELLERLLVPKHLLQRGAE